MTISKPPHTKPSRVLRKEVVRLQQASITRIIENLQEGQRQGVKPIFLGQRQTLQLSSLNPNIKKG